MRRFEQKGDTLRERRQKHLCCNDLYLDQLSYKMIYVGTSFKSEKKNAQTQPVNVKMPN